MNAGVLGIWAERRKSGAMNDVRRSALKRVLLAAGLMLGVGAYLWQVDYGTATLPPHSTPFIVAFVTPAFLVFLQSAKRLVTGQH